VGVREAHALRRQTVKVWRPDFRRAIAAEFPVAEIVGEDENDIGFGCGCARFDTALGGEGCTAEDTQSTE
jgi:hypothetical protein